jgi:hypothetical protein
MTGPHDVQPLIPNKRLHLHVDHSRKSSVQYEFYIPAAIWSHTAVRVFRAALHRALSAGGATVVAATGLWAGAQEDTNIHRVIVGPRKGEDSVNRIALRALIEPEVGKMLVSLAEWRESEQDAFFFTEAELERSLASSEDATSSLPTRRPRQPDSWIRTPPPDDALSLLLADSFSPVRAPPRSA